MIFICSAMGLLLIGILINRLAGRATLLNFISVYLIGFGVGSILLICVTIPLYRCEVYSNLHQLTTLKNGSWLEYYVEGKKYWNSTLFDLWIPDEINNY